LHRGEPRVVKVEFDSDGSQFGQGFFWNDHRDRDEASVEEFEGPITDRSGVAFEQAVIDADVPAFDLLGGISSGDGGFFGGESVE